MLALPEFRDKGIGSHLLTEARRWSQKQRLELPAVSPSDRSSPFYERSGFLRERDPLVLKIAAGNS
ncbi:MULTISPECIES: GNAT family N-acetyltransferase [unclassified Burkholderia]|uniref:GNAT family N-acetyltransferase n=1 Tax=unclassified Burkholderia TaxID=2613784 RepID=UPI000AC48E1D